MKAEAGSGTGAIDLSDRARSLSLACGLFERPAAFTLRPSSFIVPRAAQ
jgi:hypothetical protein